MNKAHEIRIYPNKAQEILLRKSCGVARFSYNWALAKWEEMRSNGDRPTAFTLCKLVNSIKRQQFPFFLEVSKTAAQYGIHNLEKAFKIFFKKNAKYPKFKKKGVKDCFVAIDKQQSFKQKNNKIYLPRIGPVACAENLRFEGKVNFVVVKRIADMWFSVINIEVPDSAPALKQNMGDNQAIVGVDLGIKSMIVLSDGTVFENPKAYKTNLRRLKQRQRRLSKKKKGSKNKQKSRIRLARSHYKVSCIRKNAIHNATTQIVKKYNAIVIEDLNVRGMTRNSKLSAAISEVSFGEIRRQLQYKTKWAGKELIVADRFYPSSKTCNNCGHKKGQLKLSERIYTCENCNLSIDRDLNAAKNLANYGTTPKCGESHASGFGSSVAEMQHSPKLNEEIKDSLI